MYTLHTLDQQISEGIRAAGSQELRRDYNISDEPKFQDFELPQNNFYIFIFLGIQLCHFKICNLGRKRAAEEHYPIRI